VEFPPLLDEPLNPEWDLGVAAQHTVLFHFREVLVQRQVVWDNVELEGVHQIRVAARRTRTALQTLRALWSGPEVRRFERYLERFATAFGLARDLDVMILYFEELVATATDERAVAYRWLLERNRLRRVEEQPKLERILRKMEQSAFPAAFVTYFSHMPLDLWALGVQHG
jgi:CHAD domain-containing protein